MPFDQKLNSFANSDLTVLTFQIGAPDRRQPVDVRQRRPLIPL